MTRDIALVIGIDQYDYKEFDNLNGANNDARSMIKWLKNHVPGITIFSLLSENEEIYLDSVRRKVKDIIIECSRKKGDNFRRLFFYFAGHGHSMSYDDCSFLTQEADFSEESTKYENYVPSYSARELHRFFFDSIYFDEILILQDCCRERRNDVKSTPFPFHTLSIADQPKKVRMQRSVIGYACNYGGFARESKNVLGIYRGHFTSATEQVLERNMDNRNFMSGMLITELEKYLLNDKPVFHTYENREISLWSGRNNQIHQCLLREKPEFKGTVKNFKIKNGNPTNSSDIYLEFDEDLKIELYPLIYKVEYELEGKSKEGFINIFDYELDLDDELSEYIELYYDKRIF